jgi:hypothetical protein
VNHWGLKVTIPKVLLVSSVRLQSAMDSVAGGAFKRCATQQKNIEKLSAAAGKQSLFKGGKAL